MALATSVLAMTVDPPRESLPLVDRLRYRADHLGAHHEDRLPLDPVSPGLMRAAADELERLHNMLGPKPPALRPWLPLVDRLLHLANPDRRPPQDPVTAGLLTAAAEQIDALGEEAHLGVRERDKLTTYLREHHPDACGPAQAADGWLLGNALTPADVARRVMKQAADRIIELERDLAAVADDAKALQDLLDEPARRYARDSTDPTHSPPSPHRMPLGELLRYAQEWVKDLRRMEAALMDLRRELDSPGGVLRQDAAAHADLILGWVNARLIKPLGPDPYVAALRKLGFGDEYCKATDPVVYAESWIAARLEEDRSHQTAARAAEMWKARCRRYEEWFALSPSERHPLGPEFAAD